MIQLIVGNKGSGKTKHLIELVNSAVTTEQGSVICIEKGTKLTYDISRDARLINITDYPVKGYDAFFGFICGSYSQNYDIDHIFIDSLYKVVDCVAAPDNAKLEEFIRRLDAFTKINKLNVTITISADISELPEIVKDYICK